MAEKNSAASKKRRARAAPGVDRRATDLESRVPFLGTIGATAPFVGLFGNGDWAS